MNHEWNYRNNQAKSFFSIRLLRFKRGGIQHVQSKSNTSQDESCVIIHNCLKHDKWFIWHLRSQNLWTCWVSMDGFVTSWNLKSSAEAVTSCLKDLLLSCKTYKYKHPDILFSYVQLYRMEAIHIPYIGLTCSFFLIRGCCLTAFVFINLKLHLLLLRQRNDTPYYLPFVTNLLLLLCCWGTAKRLWKVCFMLQVSGKPRLKMSVSLQWNWQETAVSVVSIGKPWIPQAHLSSTGWMISARKPFWNWIWHMKAGWTILMPCDILPKR